jgi:hypothetical protein
MHNIQNSESINLVWTLSPGKTLPGVAGSVTTVCSTTRDSALRQTNIRLSTYSLSCFRKHWLVGYRDFTYDTVTTIMTTTMITTVTMIMAATMRITATVKMKLTIMTVKKMV